MSSPTKASATCNKATAYDGSTQVYACTKSEGRTLPGSGIGVDPAGMNNGKVVGLRNIAVVKTLTLLHYNIRIILAKCSI